MCTLVHQVSLLVQSSPRLENSRSTQPVRIPQAARFLLEWLTVSIDRVVAHVCRKRVTKRRVGGSDGLEAAVMLRFIWRILEQSNSGN